MPTEEIPKKKQKYFGFASYLETGTITEEFITDFEYWTRKIFFHWNLYNANIDDFQAVCWEALLSKLPEFNPAIATIQTLCISRINNECWRAYMKNKNAKVEIDCENPVLQSDLIEREDLSPYLLFYNFVRYCNRFGVEVDVDELYNDYKEGVDSPGMLAYASWQMKNNEVEGRNDISKKRRRASVKYRNQEQS